MSLSIKDPEAPKLSSWQDFLQTAIQSALPQHTPAKSGNFS